MLGVHRSGVVGCNGEEGGIEGGRVLAEEVCSFAFQLQQAYICLVCDLFFSRLFSLPFLVTGRTLPYIPCFDLVGLDGPRS